MADPHPWWPHLPLELQRQRRRELRWLRMRAWLSQRRHQIQLLLGFYLLLCLIPLLLGLITLTGFALLPVLLVPPVGYLIYWLVWKEFHH